MRHRVAYRKLGRITAHRISMLRNQSVALIRYERIETTVARAKELRPFVERIISIAKRSLTAPEGGAHGVTARRRVAARHRRPRGRDEAVRHDRAALRGPCRAATRGCFGWATGAATPRTSPKSSSSAASTTRRPRPRRPRPQPRARSRKKKTMGGRIRAALGGRTKKDDRTPRRQGQGRQVGQGRRQGHDAAQSRRELEELSPRRARRRPEWVGNDEPRRAAKTSACLRGLAR